MIYRALLIVIGAIVVPVTVAGAFPPPADMDPMRAMAILVWLAFIGGAAGNGLG